MKISFLGMGYVGCVSAACFAKEGHEVFGVDVNPQKVELINKGISPIVEADMPELISDMVATKRLKAVSNAIEAIKNTDICFVCVGTPSKENGDIDLQYIIRVSENIGNAIKNKNERYTVVFRSTIFPGTMEKIVIPILEERSGKKAGKDFGISFNPEFLREGTSIYDFYNPPKTVIGTTDYQTYETVEKLFKCVSGPIFRTEIKVAEMIKYTDNVFHGLKIGFANEIGRLCKKLEIDSWKVMDIFCSDEKLNISKAYFRPGYAFGGSCLPKDLRSLNYKAMIEDVDLPILKSILLSNDAQIFHVFKKILNIGKKNVGFLGFSFKEGTDDLRESPLVTLIEYLLGKGFNIKIYDKNVNLSKIIGANKQFLEKHIPHIASLMQDSVKEVIDKSDIIVIGHESDEFTAPVEQIIEKKYIIDLVRAIEDCVPDHVHYDGICW